MAGKVTTADNAAPASRWLWDSEGLLPTYLLFDWQGDGMFCWVYRDTSLATPESKAQPLQKLCACWAACSEERPGPAAGEKYPDLT